MRVLIIKQGALGDVIMATALIEALQRAHAESELFLLTTPAFAGLFRDWQDLEVVAFPRRGWRAVASTLCWIRRQHFDRVYDLQGNDRTGLLCALSGIPQRIGSHTRFPYNIHPADAWDERSHVFDRLNAVLLTAGVPAAMPLPRLPCSAEAAATVTTFLQANQLRDHGFVVMHAGASPARPDKCWPGFGALAALIEARGLRVVWLGAGADGAQNRSLASTTGIDATDLFSVSQLAELARHARFAVTNDSGPMHACAAAGVPVFALFGPSDWRRNHALGQAGHVLAGVELLSDLKGLRTADCLARIPASLVMSHLEAAGVLTPA